MSDLILSELRKRFEWCPPATREEVEDAEKALGFSLPILLKQIYLEVGNGDPNIDSGFIGVPNQSTREKRERQIDRALNLLNAQRQHEVQSKTRSYWISLVDTVKDPRGKKVLNDYIAKNLDRFVEPSEPEIVARTEAESRVLDSVDIVQHDEMNKKDVFWEFGKLRIKGNGTYYDYIDCLSPKGTVYMFDHTWGESFVEATFKITDSLEEFLVDMLFDDGKKRDQGMERKFNF